MARYIDADKFAEAICKFPAIDEYSANAVICLLRSQPIADVEEVVRCKECLNCLKVNDLDNGHWECIAHYDLHGKPYIPDLDGFYSYGQRK